jgi:hypothetical protein
VIKNERQYRITKAHAEKFRATLTELAGTPRPKNVHPKLWEAQKAGLKSQLQDLEAELHEYETLKTGGFKILELDSLEGLPKVLIHARIAAGLTQEDLAARLGVKPHRSNVMKPAIIRQQASHGFARLRACSVYVFAKACSWSKTDGAVHEVRVRSEGTQPSDDGQAPRPCASL